MIRSDDRTHEQRKTHHFAIVARDSFMSGWGLAAGGYSRVAWAMPAGVSPDKVEDWVRSRTEMKYVNFVDLDTYRPPRSTSYFHIYVVEPSHPAATY